jgi:hypothetical protein
MLPTSEAAYYEMMDERAPFDRHAYNIEVYGNEAQMLADQADYDAAADAQLDAEARLSADINDIAAYADLIQAQDFLQG